MTIVDILEVAKANRIMLRVENGCLKYRAPKGALTSELQKLFKDNTGGLIAELEKSEVPDITRIPLSYNQQSLWFLHQMAPESPAYNVAAACQVLSRINIDSVKCALKNLISRHPILRTTYILNAESKMVFQMISSTSDAALEHIDVAGWDDDELKKRIISSYTIPFNLSSGPIFRVQIFSRSINDHIFMIVLHHIACDARSIHILIDEFITFYNAAPGTPPVDSDSVIFKYTDFISHQTEMLSGEHGTRLLNYWKEKLDGASAVLDLPLDYKRPLIQSHIGSSVFFKIEGLQYEQIRDYVKSSNATLYTFLLCAFQLLLAKISGQRDICIGTPAAGRTRKDYQNICGYFVNPVVIRSKVDLSLTFRQYLDQTSKTVFDSLDYQEYPFSLLVENLKIERKPGIAPIFQVMFNMLKRQMLGAAADFLCPGNSNDPVAFGPLKILPYPIQQQEGQYDMTLEIIDTEKNLFCALKYCTDIFKHETAVKIVNDYRTTLFRILDRPNDALSSFVNNSENFKIALPPLYKKKMAISASFTAEPLAPILNFWSKKAGLNCEIVFSQYSQIFQQLLDPTGIFLKNENGLNIILVRFDDWMQNIDSKSSGPEIIAEENIKSIKHNALEFLRAVKSASQKMTAPLLILFCPCSPIRLCIDVYKSAVVQIENKLCTDLCAINGVFPVSSSEILMTYPVDEYYEPLGEQIGHIPYTKLFFVSAATLIARKAFTVFNQPYKAIVLDCDQTLWCGVVGEDGALGVKVDKDKVWFQNFILSQHYAGRLICLCSKNTAADVFEVLDTHPHMILKRQHIAATKINWSPKSLNLRALSKELNIGLDSLIFIDDSPLECAEVTMECREVLTLQMPGPNVDIRKFFENIWAFDYLKITGEDAKRSEYYKTAQERERFLSDTVTFADFINGLNLDIRISMLQQSDVARVSQLTQRTNQFNLTTRRRNETEIESICRQDSMSSWVVRVSDRFGDYGLVGVLVTEKKSDYLEVDTFLLSCRVLGRGVEHRMLAHLLKIACQENLDHISLPFNPTQRNQPVRDFLDNIARDFKSQKPEGLLYEIPSVAAEKVIFEPEHSMLALDAFNNKKPVYHSESGRSDITSGHAFMIDIATGLCDVHRIQSCVEAEITSPNNLSAQQLAIHQNDSGTLSQSETETQIAEVWKSYLNLNFISVNDNFFDLGGHSVLIPLIVIDLKKKFEIDITIVDMFQYSTIRALASHINNNLASPYDKTKEKIRLQKSAVNQQKQRAIMAKIKTQRQQL